MYLPCMACFYGATVDEFLRKSDDHIIAHLALAYANRGYTRQYTDLTLTWQKRHPLSACSP